MDAAADAEFSDFMAGLWRVTDSRELGMRGQVVGSTRGQALGSQRTPGWSC